MKNIVSPHLLLFGHAGYHNRGCEAIVRSTAAIFGKVFEKPRITVASFEAENDRQLEIPYVSDFVPHYTCKKYSKNWFVYQLYSKVFKKPVMFQEWLQSEVIKEAQNADACFSVGGDNYCYKPPYHLYAIDRQIKKKGGKLVLWGASIEPRFINTEMKNDLLLFDLIIVRESITFEALSRNGVYTNLYNYPDPAFTLEKQEQQLPKEWRDKEIIGINIGPLILNYEKTRGLVMKNFIKLVNYILSTTDCNIALIPHVIKPVINNDLDQLTKVFNEFKDSDRVLLIGDGYTAPQLKGFISRCRFFIGTRTHATIAAYSTCVPTLALGYSVKARGIARDIFGDEKGLVLPVQELTDERQLIYAFEGLRERENELRKHLETIMPSYIEKAGQAVKHVRKLLEE